MPTAPAGPLTQPAGTFGNLDRWNLRLARSRYIFAIDLQGHDSFLQRTKIYHCGHIGQNLQNSNRNRNTIS